MSKLEEEGGLPLGHVWQGVTPERVGLCTVRGQKEMWLGKDTICA